MPEDLSMALGSYGISPYKNAEFFSIFAKWRKKKLIQFYIEKIIDKDGNEIFFRSNEDVSKNALEQWIGKPLA